LRDSTEFFEKPVASATGVANVFDYRIALAQYCTRSRFGSPSSPGWSRRGGRIRSFSRSSLCTSSACSRSCPT
jgi:hypothetical protein